MRITEDELQRRVNRAFFREMKDDHLTTDERKAIVDAFRFVYKDRDDILDAMPFGDIDKEFVYIVFDWYEGS